ncbi:MAG: DUF5916 domain-containing protein, partial [Bacteroidales bacterium]
MRLLLPLFFLIVFLQIPLNQFAQENPLTQIRIVKTDIPPVIDGYIENTWEKAAGIDEFWQREPIEGNPVSEDTEFLLLYDKDNLYIAARCYHKDISDISSRELARDVSLGNEDRIQVILDTYLDGRNGYWFQIGPRGSIGDALVSENGRSFNKAWDGIWDGKSVIHENGWDAEMIIPFKTLGFKKEQEEWGIKFIRNIKINSESSYWPATTLDAERFQISDAGILTGLEGISQGIGLDIVPYLTTGLSKKPEDGTKTVLDAGVDAFYQITPSLKAALTINTDFAQTEVDSRQINLTRFSLFYPEKRDFFLDGANYFNFGINGDNSNPHQNRLIPFFSRRVGLDPQGNPVPVNYGAKFTGQAGKWNIGLLHIKDQNEWDNPGYSVGRISRFIGKQSYIGMILTDGNSLGDASNTLAGLDLQLASSEFREGKTLVYNLYGLKSFTPGLEGEDFSFGTEINYPNDFLRFRLGYIQIGGNFNSGLGFVPRKNIRNYYGGFRLGPRPKKFGILQINTGADFYLINDMQTGEVQSSELEVGIINIDFLSSDEVRLEWKLQYEGLTEDFNIIDSIVIPADNYMFRSFDLNLESAQRRNFWMETSFGHGSFYTGTRTDWGVEAGYQVIPMIFLGLESDRTWVNLDQGDFITQIFRANL